MNVDARYRLGWIVVAVLFCLAAALLYVDLVRFRAGTGVTYGRAAIGAPAPDVSLVTLDGHARRLSTFFGRPLVVNFFATWCEPCKAELPLVESRYVAARASGLTVLGVDQQEGPHEVRAFAAAHGVTYPIVIDTGPAVEVYGVNAIPATLFIDAGGVLRAVHVGQLTPEMLDADLRTIM